VTLSAARLDELAFSRKAELTALLERLIEAPSEKGTSGARAQAVVADYLSGSGFNVRLGEGPASVNLIAYPKTRPSRMVLFAHIDTEPARAGWSRPPLQPSIVGSRMYGLGSADDKAGVAAAAVAAVALAEAGEAVPIVASLHGKDGGTRGSQGAFATLHDCDAAVYVHPPETGAGLTQVKHASRGVLDMTIEVAGWRGPNVEIGTPESARFEDGGNPVHACLAAVDRWRARLADCEINLGRISAGDSAGVVPARCEIAVRVLFDTGTVGRIEDTIAGDLETLSERGAGNRFQGRIVSRDRSADPASVPWDAPLARTVRRAIDEVCGCAAESYTSHLASDIRFPIREAGIPAVAVGCAAGNFYSPDEWVSLDDLARLVPVLMRIVSLWSEGVDR